MILEKILDEVILIKDGQIVAKENVEDLRESSGKSVVGWLKGHHRKNNNVASEKFPRFFCLQGEGL
ncbi:hypothetical protein ACWFPQ_19570 [Peribacillus butanolivorans]